MLLRGAANTVDWRPIQHPSVFSDSWHLPSISQSGRTFLFLLQDFHHAKQALNPPTFLAYIFFRQWTNWTVPTKNKKGGRSRRQ